MILESVLFFKFIVVKKAETFTITSSCLWYLSYEKESVSSLVIARFFFGCVIPSLQQSLSDDVFPRFD